MSVPLLLPVAEFRPMPYRGDAPPFTAPPLGLCLHVQQGNGSPWRFFAGLKAPARAFSHFWVSKAGSIEQYQTTDRSAWAQGTGNGTYWSVETEGFVEEKLSTAQVKAVAQLLGALGVARAVVDTPGARGLIVHRAGGKEWGGHSCPGPIRASQRIAIIAQLGRAPKAPAAPLAAPKFPGVLAAGSRGSGVLTAQRRLQSRGWKITADGVFGPGTVKVVRAFQDQKGLGVDGKIGPITWTALWTLPL